MKKILIIYLFLATHLNAGTNDVSITTSTPSSQFDIDKQLTEISNICLTLREHEQITGDILRHGMARILNSILIEEAQQVIGIAELRSILGFPPAANWTYYKKPSKQEIAAASTIKEYYELSEPRSYQRSLNSSDFFEKNFPPAIAFLDMRIPAIRTIYQRKFENDSNGIGTDRNEIDRMIQVFRTTAVRINSAIRQSLLNNSLCLLEKGMLDNV